MFTFCVYLSPIFLPRLIQSIGHNVCVFVVCQLRPIITESKNDKLCIFCIFMLKTYASCVSFKMFCCGEAHSWINDCTCIVEYKVQNTIMKIQEYARPQEIVLIDTHEGSVLSNRKKVLHTRLLHPQHLDGIWSGLKPYRLPFDTLSEYPEPWLQETWGSSEKKTESQTWGRNAVKIPESSLFVDSVFF